MAVTENPQNDMTKVGFVTDNANTIQSTTTVSNNITEPGKTVSSEKLLNRTHIVNIPMLEDDLDIYDDPGECDGLSDFEEKDKTPRKQTPQIDEAKPAPISILRKSTNIHDVSSGYRAVANTPATYSEVDDRGSTIPSAKPKQPIGVYISRRPMRSGTRGKQNAPSGRLTSRMTNVSTESR